MDFYLTTPLYYPNARPHVGSAYTTIVCDAIARYKRMRGHDVAFLTGTDEHGEKLERAAAAAGMPPREFVAEKRRLFIELWKKLGIDYTHFVYTDQPDHVRSVQRMLVRAREAGYIDKRRYEGRYCVHCEMYVSEGAAPVDCPNCGRPAERISEENYFFRLSAFSERLLQHYQDHPEFVRPGFRMNEVTSFVKSGLRDISVSRKRIQWGIPWPDDPEQVFYVWYDALTGYLTGIGFSEGETGSAEFQKYWRNDEAGEVVHMIGKDILRFHAVYWPAFLMAAGLVLPKTVFAHGWIYYDQDKMSKSKGNVVYPEPITDALESFGAPGNDALRYYLLRDTPFGRDGNFSYEGLIQRYNSDLANDLGNLASRTLTMLNGYCEGKVPQPLVDPQRCEHWAGTPASSDVSLHPDREVLNFIENSKTQYVFERAKALAVAFPDLLGNYEIFNALDIVWGAAEEGVSKAFITSVNKYLSDNAPWKLAEADLTRNKDKIATILYTAAEGLRFVTVLLAPIVPYSAARLWKLLGCEAYLGKLEDQRIDQLQWGGLKVGTRVARPGPIFPRLDKVRTLAKLHALAEADLQHSQPKGVPVAVPFEKQPAADSRQSVEGSRQSAPGDQQSAIGNRQSPIPSPKTESPTVNPEPQTLSPETVTIDDFAKVELRAGQVISAEPIPGARRLLKLQVDIGTEVRQVVAGIAEHYAPQDLVGKKVVLVANLQPRKLRGVESNGMILAASVGPQDKPVLVTFVEDVPNGARLK